MELWDLLDKDRNPLHRTIVRTKNMRLAPNEYHLVVSILTVNSKGEMLLTLRDPEKEPFPNLWENTTGSVLAGESSIEGAVRELREETGIEAKEEDFIFLDAYTTSTALVDVYLVQKDVELEDLTMQVGETVDAQWANYETFMKLVNSQQVADPVWIRFQRVSEDVLPYLTVC